MEKQLGAWWTSLVVRNAIIPIRLKGENWSSRGGSLIFLIMFTTKMVAWLANDPHTTFVAGQNYNFSNFWTHLQDDRSSRPTKIIIFCTIYFTFWTQFYYFWLPTSEFPTLRLIYLFLLFFFYFFPDRGIKKSWFDENIPASSAFLWANSRSLINSSVA